MVAAVGAVHFCSILCVQMYCIPFQLCKIHCSNNNKNTFDCSQLGFPPFICWLWAVHWHGRKQAIGSKFQIFKMLSPAISEVWRMLMSFPLVIYDSEQDSIMLSIWVINRLNRSIFSQIWRILCQQISPVLITFTLTLLNLEILFQNSFKYSEPLNLYV